MSTKISSPREFRRGRTLMNADRDFVLVTSPAPREWIGVQIDATTGAYNIRRVASNKLAKEYDHLAVGGVRNPLSPSDVINVITSLAGLPWDIPSVEFRVRYSLGKKAAYTPAYPPLAIKKKPSLTSVRGVIEELEATTKAPKPAPAEEATTLGKRASVFTIPEADEKPYWYESDSDRKLLRDFISLRKAQFTVNLMIAGPSGAGKTVGVQRLGEELGIPVHIINCQAITTPEKWLGQMMADPEKGTYFVPSQHIEWVERTHEDCKGAEQCILLYDEITRLRPELNNMTYSLFDTQRGLEVPQMGRRVMMAPENLVISTANIGAAFAGTFGQDRAFRERFAMTMERDFPPLNEEVKILTSATGIVEAHAQTLCRIAESSRRMWKAGTIEQPISTRTLVTWALLVAGGYSVIQAAEYTVLPMYSEDGGVDSDRAKIRLEIEGKSR